jgi:hypothetical protein
MAQSTGNPPPSADHLMGCPRCPHIGTVNGKSKYDWCLPVFCKRCDFEWCVCVTCAFGKPMTKSRQLINHNYSYHRKPVPKPSTPIPRQQSHEKTRQDSMMRLIEAELERRSLAGNSQSEEVETSRETVEIGRSREPPTTPDQMLSPTSCQKSPDLPGIRFSPEEQLVESPSCPSYLGCPATGNDTDHLPPPNL